MAGQFTREVMPARPSARPTRYITEPGRTPERGSSTTTLNTIGLSAPDDPSTLCVPPGPGCDRRCTYLCTVGQLPEVDRSTGAPTGTCCTKVEPPVFEKVNCELASSNTLLVSTVIDGGAASNRMAWTALPTFPARSMPRTVTSSLLAPSAPAGSRAVPVVPLIVPAATTLAPIA